MRKIAILIIFIFFGITSFAQQANDLYEKNFNIGLDVYSNIWMKLPDNMEQKGLNMGYSVYGLYNHMLKKSPLSVAGGAGITSISLSSNSVIHDALADVITFDTIASGIEYDRSKVTFTYLDFPIELRYKTPKQFRLAIGIKIGFRLDNHSKYKGERLDGSGVRETIKEKDILHTEKIFVTSTLRAGYKKINLVFNYSLSRVFQLERGPEMHPFSIGFTFMPF